jgi:transcriptional regulator with XRE-family HTH domain
MTDAFGGELRRLRKEAGLRLKDLADALGWSIKYVSDIERGKMRPPDARTLGVILARIGRPEALPDLLRRAAESTGTCDVEVGVGVTREALDLLVGLKHRIECGTLDPETCGRMMMAMGEDD